VEQKTEVVIKDIDISFKNMLVLSFKAAGALIITYATVLFLKGFLSVFVALPM
jgi:hypothetical protein